MCVCMHAPRHSRSLHQRSCPGSLYRGSSLLSALLNANNNSLYHFYHSVRGILGAYVSFFAPPQAPAWTARAELKNYNLYKCACTHSGTPFHCTSALAQVAGIEDPPSLSASLYCNTSCVYHSSSSVRGILGAMCAFPCAAARSCLDRMGKSVRTTP
jgi:hypothetical protein